MSDKTTELERRLGLGRRAELFLWFRDNAATVSAVVDRLGGSRRVNWSEFATYLNEQGVRGRDNKPVTADMARKAWSRASGRQPASAGVSQAAVAPARPAVNGSGTDQVKRMLARIGGDDVPIPRVVK